MHLSTSLIFIVIFSSNHFSMPRGMTLRHFYWAPSGNIWEQHQILMKLLTSTQSPMKVRPSSPPPRPLISSSTTSTFSTQSPLQCGRRVITEGDHRRPKIVGGNEPTYGAYPWQVEIALFDVENGSWKHHCGGAIMGAVGDLILTAAHCLQPPVEKNQLRVIAGDHDLQKLDLHEQTMIVTDYLLHPDFRRDGPYSNDIAILKVQSRTGRKQGFAFNNHVQPICLPKLNAGPPAGTWCDVSGWGAQESDNMDSLSSTLRAVSVPIIETSLCRDDDLYGGRQQSILDSMVCAGHLEGGQDACGGDSGGPLACFWNESYYLTGLVSWGDGCAKKNRPGVYTRIDYFIDWIEKSSQVLRNR